ncbi:hypothetical protein R1sor_016587 [Riccia sorocarpa]|uniref:Uncharacterized protein n=1 Tax=Riccia sorocarpa TaxID=122646 RepID=A0ABD3HFV2_9MARC
MCPSMSRWPDPSWGHPPQTADSSSFGDLLEPFDTPPPASPSSPCPQRDYSLLARLTVIKTVFVGELEVGLGLVGRGDSWGRGLVRAFLLSLFAWEIRHSPRGYHLFAFTNRSIALEMTVVREVIFSEKHFYFV